jgi:hypothetical protein
MSPLIGSRLNYFIRQDYSWGVEFDCGFGMTVYCPWRVVVHGGIAITDGDHAQKFGLPEPVDAALRAVEAIGRAAVIAVRADPETADLRFDFGGGARLEIWSSSSAYEGWTADLPWKHGRASLVGMGGGEIVVWRA